MKNANVWRTQKTIQTMIDNNKRQSYWADWPWVRCQAWGLLRWRGLPARLRTTTTPLCQNEPTPSQNQSHVDVVKTDWRTSDTGTCSTTRRRWWNTPTVTLHIHPSSSSSSSFLAMTERTPVQWKYNGVENDKPNESTSKIAINVS